MPRLHGCFAPLLQCGVLDDKFESHRRGYCSRYGRSLQNITDKRGPRRPAALPLDIDRRLSPILPVHLPWRNCAREIEAIRFKIPSSSSKRARGKKTHLSDNYEQFKWLLPHYVISFVPSFSLNSVKCPKKSNCIISLYNLCKLCDTFVASSVANGLIFFFPLGYIGSIAHTPSQPRPRPSGVGLFMHVCILYIDSPNTTYIIIITFPCLTRRRSAHQEQLHRDAVVHAGGRIRYSGKSVTDTLEKSLLQPKE